MKLDALLERPYYDSPPNTAGSRGNEYFRVEPTVEVSVTDGWGPAWLRRKVLSVFLVSFGLLAVVGEIVLWLVNNRNLEAVVSGLWTFGPIVGKSSQPSPPLWAICVDQSKSLDRVCYTLV